MLEGNTAAEGIARSEGGAGAEFVLARLSIQRLALVVALLAVFAVSVAVRLPYIGRPMGMNHEEGTARTLVHSAGWWEDGPSRGGYIMRLNLTSPGDAYLPGSAEDGNLYYYSFSPGHPLWMFLAHRVVGLRPTVLSVRLVNLGLHLLSALMVYLIVREMLRRLPDAWSRFAGFAAFSVYAFSPVTMWYQSNVYTSASAVQPLFIASVLVAARAYRDDGRLRARLLLLGALAFLMVYTEWLGLAFAAVAAALAFLRRRDPVARRIGIAAVAGAALSIVAVVIQYWLSLGGLRALFERVRERYLARSGLDGQSSTFRVWDPAAWTRLLRMYFKTLGPAIIGLLALIGWERVAGRGKPRRFNAGEAPAAVVLTLALAPVLLHHLVLFDHAVAHNFDILKAAVFVSVASGLLVGRLLARHARTEGTARYALLAGVGAVLVAVAASSAAFLSSGIGRPERVFQRVGERIAEETRPDEVVFVQSAAYIAPRITSYYAGRTYLAWKDTPGWAGSVLGRAEERTGVLLVLDRGLGVSEIQYVGRDGALYETRQAARAAVVAR